MLDHWLAALLDSSLKGFVLCLAAGAAAFALRRASAAARHLVWRLALAGLLALPVLAAVLPQWRVAVPGLEKPAPSVAVSPQGPHLPGPPLPEGEEGERRARRPAATDLVSPLSPGERGVRGVRADGASGPGFVESGGIGAEPVLPTPSWPAILFGLWLVGVLAVLFVLATALFRVRRLRRAARPIRDEAWSALLGRVRAELGLRRPVALVAGGEGAMPMTWGWRRPVVLLPAEAGGWSEPRRRAVLLHELAHVVRRDYPVQLGAELARALYWFNPLVWVAVRRLRLESEHACDDRVLAAGARATDYAGDLLEIARSLCAVRAAAPAGLAMARPSHLARRLLAVLDGGRNRRGVSRRFAFPAWLAAFCVVLPLAALAPAAAPAAASSPPLTPAPPAAPAPPAPPAGPDGSGHYSAHFGLGNDTTFESSKGGHRIKVRTKGKLALTDDWTGIASLAHGAWMRLEEDDGRTERRLDVEPGSNGSPVYTWKVDGEKRAFDAEGHKWLQGMLLQFLRGSGYDAERRVAWFLKRQGPDGVLAEISQIPGDYGKSIYFQKLFATRGLGADAVSRALAQAGREIGSDYDLAQALLAAAAGQQLAGGTALAYVEATRTIDSDYDHRRALTGLLEKGRLDPGSLAALLRVARRIGSDYDLATLLVEVAKKSELKDAGVRAAYAEAAKEVGSDYDHRRALSAMVQRGDLAPEALLTVLQSSREIGSSYDRATLLVEVADKYQLSGAAREAYLDAAGSISSEYDRQRAEAALGRK